MSLDEVNSSAEQQQSRGVSRRFLLGAGAGVAGAAALGALAPSAAAAPPSGGSSPAGGGHGGDNGGRIVPRNRFGVQHWSVRDATVRLDRSVSGYLGGRSFLKDPTDRGPLRPLPGGFEPVFDLLASAGYQGFEFFQYTQGPNGAITTKQIRAALDRAGLVSAGTHTGALPQMIDPTYRNSQIEIAHILGHRMIGGAQDAFPGTNGNPPSGLLADWQLAAHNANMVGEALHAAGLRYFFHPEDNWWMFFKDPAHPELDRVHRIDWFTHHTDPRYVFFEPDTMHTLAGRAKYPDPVDGRLFDVNAWYGRLTQTHRMIAWHIKDAVRITPMVAPGQSPFSQTVNRPGFFANPDVVYVGEGSIGKGYPVDPDPEVLGFREQLTLFPVTADPGWYHNESDGSVGPASDPGRSLRWAKVSAPYTLDLRRSKLDHCTVNSMRYS